MKNITQSGYETITVVRSQYEPTTGQCLTISPVLWIYENPHTKEKKYFLVLSSNNCVNYIFEFKDIPEPELLKLITQCGEVTPNENGEIIHTGSCGARTVAADCKDLCITVNTDWGLTGGGNVCAGESITLSIDKENTNLVTSNSLDAKDGDSVVYDGTNGKAIRKAQQWRIGDAENKWTGRFDPETKNLNIFPDDKATDPMLTMLPSGVILTPNQPKFSARLTASTPVFSTKAYYKIGSTLALEKIRDEDGYNKNANNFFPGDGAGNFAYFTCPYPGIWGIQYQFVIDQGQTTSGTRMIFRLAFGKPDAYQYLKYEYRYTNNTAQTVASTRFLPLKKDDTFHFEILIDSDTAKPFIRNDTSGTEISNYCGVYLALG